MKKLLLIATFIGGMTGCNNSSSVNTANHKASDTITNVTNPGVGAVSDDTTIKD